MEKHSAAEGRNQKWRPHMSLTRWHVRLALTSQFARTATKFNDCVAVQSVLPWVVVLGLWAVGCSRQQATVDDAPFRTAIGQYLQANNMAMKIKEVKVGPTVSGDTAHLQASMTHEQLGGPAVTWDFDFARQPDGSWRVLKHQD